MQIYRIFAVVVALVFCYFAVQFGDLFHYVIAKDPSGTGFLYIAASVIITILTAVAAAAVVDMCFEDELTEIYLTVIGGFGFGFLFGLFAGPTTAWGPYPWHWLQSKTAIILVFALLPPIYLLVKCVVEALKARRARSNSTVTPFRTRIK